MNLLASLRYLVALHEHRHFGRAAQACHITQPALSNALRALEKEFGVVVVRRGRSFEGFTPEGEPIASRNLSGGGLTFSVPPFAGAATNITPDADTGIGRWSDDDIKRAIVEGKKVYVLDGGKVFLGQSAMCNDHDADHALTPIPAAALPPPCVPVPDDVLTLPSPHPQGSRPTCPQVRQIGVAHRYSQSRC